MCIRDRFNPEADAQVSAFALQVNGKIIVGGDFSTINGEPRHYLARLNPDGTLDPTFNPAPDFYINTVAIQTDGAVLVGGSFSHIGGQARSSIAPVSYTHLATSSALVLTNVQRSDAGAYDAVVTNVQGSIASSLALLSVNLAAADSFDPGANGSVNALAIQPDGKLLVGGSFTALGPCLLYTSRAARPPGPGTQLHPPLTASLLPIKRK